MVLWVAAGVVNALLLPFVLGCLYCLARTAPSQPLRLQGIYAVFVALALLIVGGVGLYAAIAGSFG